MCTRPCSTEGESTSQQLTQSDDSERFEFDDELDTLMRDLDSKNFRINPSPSSGDFLEDLDHELHLNDSDQSLLDLFASSSQKMMSSMTRIAYLILLLVISSQSVWKNLVWKVMFWTLSSLESRFNCNLLCSLGISKRSEILKT